MGKNEGLKKGILTSYKLNGNRMALDIGPDKTTIFKGKQKITVKTDLLKAVAKDLIKDQK